MEIPSTGPDKGAQGTRPSQHSKSPDWHASGENSPYPNSMYAPISEPELQVNTQPASYHEPATSPSTSAHPSLSEASQSSTLEYQKRLETPPSSLSNPSSQGHPPRIGQDLVQESKEHGVASVTRLESYSRSQPPPLDTNITQWPVAHNGGLGGESIHWQKRTASGDIKPSGASLPTSPVNNIRRGHAKNASISSNGSQIGELSAQLRTRLSYAMVKVQHGWQSRTISEIETLTSQHASPISTTTTSRPFDSPLTNSTTYNTDRTGFAQSSERSTATPEYVHAAPHLHNGTSGLDYAYPLPATEPSYSPIPTTRTYEQFWRDHPSTPRHPHTAPSLAPPVDIQPRNPRRPNPSQPLTSLHTNFITSTGTLPSTPPRQHQEPAPAIRTPSQNAAMEKDAVETLLFMSSPGNSGYRPPARHLVGKRVGFPANHNHHHIQSDDLSSDEEMGRTVGLLPPGMGMGLGMAVRGSLGGGDDDIDELLDAEGERGSSSDDDDDDGEELPVARRGFITRV
ncbi:hypothetical protein MMC08_007675 [Hypocenomyce scalaris]|nr:hypothetical protein [Hypocenomyce scalaris]